MTTSATPACLPPDMLVAPLPRIDLEAHEALRFAQGQTVARAKLPDATYRVYAADGFAGIATVSRRHRCGRGD